MEWVARQVDRSSLAFGAVPSFTARYGIWIVVLASVLAEHALLVSPTIANAQWLSTGVLLVMLAVGVLARLRGTDARVSTSA